MLPCMAKQPSDLGELEAYIKSLEQQRKALLAEQLTLEKQNIVPAMPVPGRTTPAERQTRFMNGFAAADRLTGLPRGERLYEIVMDQRAIGDAIAELERKRLLLEGERHAAQAEAILPKWNALCRDLILAAERLKHLEAKAAGVPMPVRQLLPLSGFIGPRPIFPNVNWASDPTGAVRREALKLGVLSARDIEEAKS
jgi:hypothetical protein